MMEHLAHINDLAFPFRIYIAIGQNIFFYPIQVFFFHGMPNDILFRFI